MVRLNIPDQLGKPIFLDLKIGDYVYVVGANGSGKSSLMYKFFTQNPSISHRISGHRQTWFNSDEISLNGQSKTQIEQQKLNQDSKPTAIWKDDLAFVRSALSIFRITDRQNERTRDVYNLIKGGKTEEAEGLAAQDSPLDALNRAFRYANLSVQFSLKDNSALRATKRGSLDYSIAELSDGERNALLLASDILTVPAGTLLLVDEPERHLHRSIVAPLLSHLFEIRKDCMFIVSTHEVQIAAESDSSRALLIRDCVRNGKSIVGWEADLVVSGTDIDDSLRRDILGSRRKVLFIEGGDSSLDKLLYSLVFPYVSIIPKRGCAEVEKAVVGSNSCASFNWIQAFGIIDNDRRSEDEINALKTRNVFALPIHDIESIYYHPETYTMLANRLATVTAIDVNIAVNSANEAVIKAAKQHTTRMCQRVCEKRARDALDLAKPNFADMARESPINVIVDIPSLVAEEVGNLNSAIESNSIPKIVTSYPLRETEALLSIAKSLGFQSRNKYEDSVRKMVADDQMALEHVQSFFGDLVNRLLVD